MRPVEQQIALEAVAVPSAPPAFGALCLLVESLSAAGPDGLDVGTIRDPHRVLAVALLDAAGFVEPTSSRRLRLTDQTRQRVNAAGAEGVH